MVIDLLAPTDHGFEFVTPRNRHLAAFGFVDFTSILCRGRHNEHSCEEVEVGQHVDKHLGGNL